jgi:hypothetical protein
VCPFQRIEALGFLLSVTIASLDGYTPSKANMGTQAKRYGRNGRIGQATSGAGSDRSVRE